MLEIIEFNSLRTELESKPNYDAYCDYVFLHLPLDEFNTSILANLIAWKFKKTNETKLAVFGYHALLPLYSNFDLLITLDEFLPNSELSPVDLLANNREQRLVTNSFVDQLIIEFNLFSMSEEFIDALLEKYPRDSLHHLVFSMSIDFLLENGSMLKATESSLSAARAFIGRSQNRKVVYIIGRNREIHPQYNEKLFSAILFNLFLGRLVLNGTLPRPMFRIFKLFPNYLEIENHLNSYNFTLALMEIADKTYVVGNAGGVSVHMLSNAELVIVGPMTWVNNVAFSYRGVTLYSARLSSGLKTRNNLVLISPKKLPRFLASKIKAVLRQVFSA